MGRPVTGIFSAEQVPRWAPPVETGADIIDLEEFKSRPSTEYVRFFGLEKVPAAKEEEMAV